MASPEGFEPSLPP